MGSLFRYNDMINTPEVVRRLANGMNRASGLAAWTQAGKWAFGMEFMHTLGRISSETFATMDPKCARVLAHYGIDAADWEAIRATELYQHKRRILSAPRR